MTAIDVKASKLMQSITLRVRGLNGLGWRIWLAGKVLRIAGRVLRTPVELEIGETDKREIRRLRLRTGDILVVKPDRRLSTDQHMALASHFRTMLNEAGRGDVKLIIADQLTSLEVLSRSACVGYQPLTGDGAPANPPNQGSAGRKATDAEKDAALRACVEAMGGSAPCYDDYWAAVHMAERALGERT